MDFEWFWSLLVAQDARLRNTGTRIIIDVGELKNNLRSAFNSGRFSQFPTFKGMGEPQRED